VRNLFIIGAQRSGSTYLYHTLDSHPEVAMAHPVRPEPKFFMGDLLCLKDRECYESTYFNNCNPNTLYFGEKSTSYIEDLNAISRIKSFYPGAKFLLILRDPVLRAYSSYRFSVAHGLEDLGFADALLAESSRLQDATFTTSVTPYAYRKRGQYIDYINQLLKVLDYEQLKIIIFEEYVGDIGSIQKLYRWLNINDTFMPPSLNEVVNSASVKCEEQAESFKDLALGYQDSISQLELMLGRKIHAWHQHHKRLIM
jgi:hypothetical protein